MLRKQAWTFSFVGALLVLIVAAVGFRPSHRGAAPDGVENLRAFAKLYGYVRYFHPSDAASAVDWDRFAIHGVREVHDAASPEELRATLEALFEPIAPTMQIYAGDEQPSPPAAVLMPDDTASLALVAWQHKGVDLGARSPYRSVRLNRETVVDRGPAFGPFAQRVDAVPHRGKQVRLRAAVKAEVSGAGNQAQLWLRVDRPDRQMGFFDNMGDRPVTTPEWATYEIMGTVAEDAEHLLFGGFLHGHGKAWFDDVQLFVRESDRASWTPLPLDNAGFEASVAGEPPAGWGASGPGYEYATVADAYEGEHSLAVESSEAVQRTEPLIRGAPCSGRGGGAAFGAWAGGTGPAGPLQRRRADATPGGGTAARFPRSGAAGDPSGGADGRGRGTALRGRRDGVERLPALLPVLRRR